MFEFKLPDLGEGIHEGEILKWHVDVGSQIKEDEPLVDVETDKAAVTIPSPRSGKIAVLNGNVGDFVNVGDVITVITVDGEAMPEPVAPVVKTETQAVEEKPSQDAAPAPEASAPERQPGRPVPAAPATRRLARELGVDINQIPASGPAGRVTPDDVQSFASGEVIPAPVTDGEIAAVGTTDKRAVAEFSAHAASAIPFLDIDPLPDFSKLGPVETEALRSIRRKVAHKMVTSMILVPHVAHIDEVDVTDLEAFRRREKEKRAGQPGSRLTMMAFVMKALTASLKNWKMFNASLDPFKEEIVYKRYYNIGFAADTPRGLIVPVVKGADSKSILDMAADIERLAEAARESTIEAADLQGNTITITNVGSIGGTGLIPTINYPDVAILGMGKVQDKPVVRNGNVVVRKMLPLTLAFDHRIADGAQAARFMNDMTSLLADPNKLMLEA